MRWGTRRRRYWRGCSGDESLNSARSDMQSWRYPPKRTDFTKCTRAKIMDVGPRWRQRRGALLSENDGLPVRLSILHAKSLRIQAPPPSPPHLPPTNSQTIAPITHLTPTPTPTRTHQDSPPLPLRSHTTPPSPSPTALITITRCPGIQSSSSVAFRPHSSNGIQSNSGRNLSLYPIS